MIRVGVDAVCWHPRLAAGDATLPDVLDEAAAVGASFVQLSLAYAREAEGGLPAVRAAAAERGLALRASGGPLGRRYHERDAGRAADALAGWLREAAELGSPGLMVHSGVYRPEIAGDEQARDDELAHLAAVLDSGAEVAAEVGVAIELENASDFDARDLAKLIAGRESDRVAAFLDITNPYNVWDDPYDAIARLAPIAAAGHVKDFALDSLWSVDRYHRHGFSVLFRYPGEGVVDQRGLLGALTAELAGRDFDLSIEGLDSRPGIVDQEPRLRRSMALIRELLSELGEPGR